MSVTTPEYVEAPPTAPLPFGLLSVAQVVDHPEGDRKWRFGIQYEPPGCASVGDAEGVCATALSLQADPNNDDTVDIAPTAGGLVPTGTYTIDWDEGDPPEEFTADEINAGVTHTYAAPGSYDITIAGPGGYQATVTVDTTTTAPVAADAATTYVTQDGIPLVTGDPFVVYAELMCRLRADLEARAREAMRLRGPYAVEVVTGRRLEAASPVLVGGATALHPVDAVGALEEYAGSVYGGPPVLHMGRRVATGLASYGVLTPGSGRLETKLGSYVAAGAGYHTLRRGGAAPAAGTAVIYATGAVRVDRPVTPDIIGPLIGYDAGTGNRTNDITVRAQAEHIVSWECFTAVALVTLPYREPAA